MSKGIIYFAPGQPDHVTQGIEKKGYKVEIDSQLGVDCAFGTPESKLIEIEFKSVPRDLVSSLRLSARMSRQIITLGSNEGPSILMLIGEPKYEWRYNKRTGERHYMLMDGHRETGLTYGEQKLRELTLAMIGVWPCYLPGWDVVAETVCEFYEQFQKKNHASHLIRPNFSGGNIMESWPKPNQGDLILHIFQGWQGIGQKKANDLWRTFENLRIFAIAGEQYYRKVPGIGAKGAAAIEKQMAAKWSDYNKDKK